jgi:hypothetical protein
MAMLIFIFGIVILPMLQFRPSNKCHSIKMWPPCPETTRQLNRVVTTESTNDQPTDRDFWPISLGLITI